MKSNLSDMFRGGIVWAMSLALASTFLTACSDDKGVAGGSTEDAGIIANLNVAGLTQKGPFVKGSEVTVQGIDCKTMKLTNEHFEGKVKSDKGDFAIDGVSLKSTCALFEVTGKYRNEFTGKESSEGLTLHALTDLKDRKNVNINVLTELEYERLMYLVTEKGKKFAEAKAQAEEEVLAAFDIKGDFGNSEDLTIYESGDGNAALLAVSVLMQAKTDDAGLATRIEKFADSFAETGKWNDDKTKATIEEWQVAATADGTLDSIRKNVESWGYADVVPAFEKYVEAFGDTVILSSDSLPSSSSTPVEDLSSSSVTLAVPCKTETEDNCEYGTLTDERDGQTYKTVKIGDQVWMAENLNIDAANSCCYHDSAEYCSKYGRLYNWAGAMDAEGKWSTNSVNCRYTGECSPTYPVRGACPEGWHLPDSTEWGKLLTAVGGLDVAAKMLKSTSGWQDCEEENCNGTDAYGFSALPAGYMDRYGSAFTYYEGVSTGFYTSTQVDKNDAYRVYLYRNNVVNFTSDIKADGFSVRCVKDDVSALESSSGVTPQSSSGETSVSSSSVEVQPNSSETESSSSSGDDKMNCSALLEGETDWNWDVPKECRFNPDIDYGTMIDTRDNKQYKTVKIGDQVWMAENLNFDPGQGGSGDAKYDWSWCHNNKAEHCDVAGRFYTWAAAIDSVKLATDADKTMDCGYGKECGLDSAGSATLIQGICPDGWHLPNNGEWNSLFTAVGGSGKAGTLLKSQTGWYGNGNGTDAFGFTALSVGRSYSYANFDFDGLYAYFWSATENDSSYAYGMYLYYRGDDVGAGLFDSYKNYGFSVRCIKD
ncbi:fibrobacter succinogenes major paralogous domain-containing protein [Fibrobacter sp. UWR2]|uniref:fibrobacter succinogenes major paralogous domain-containing protein n=1 Tax=Fibrobacter sp. UWR2 TaxID=1964352 RepID=UPI000B655779|nr:fibrobacter succinogenes major paralogous domain-containing protein [Fibrobacter sp. UWR2]OWV01726.1 hypothetical protein B7994_00370 [Fibrobacter sp. UWR2]